jgi:DNA excision repair protein ERCC-2
VCKIEEHFPYPTMRRGQAEFIYAVLRSLKGGINVIEAPSGLGKTSGVLSAISCLSELERARFIYAVRTHSQVSRVMEECLKFPKIRMIALRGKGEICINWKVRRIKNNFLMNMKCEELRKLGNCPYYPPKIREARRCHDPLLLEVDSCPYYASLGIINGYDAVVLCYPYLFEEELYSVLKGFDPDYLIIDEAHNLRKFWLSRIVTTIEIEKIERVLNSLCERWIDIVRSLRRSGLQSLEVPKNYLIYLLRECLSSVPKPFEHFSKWILSEVEGSKRIILELPNLIFLKGVDRSLEESLKRFKSVLLISGTWSEEVARGEILEELNYERISLDRWGEVASFIVRDFTTRFEERSRLEFYRIASTLAELSEAVVGNMGIFASSYEVLQGILNAGFENMVEKPLFIERKDMDSHELSRMISEFKSMSSIGAILLGVQGGRSSEGEDFPGLQMTASIVLGLQLSKPDTLGRVQEILWRRYTKLEDPILINACRSAIQAAARPVRSQDDMGFIAFVDRRFSSCLSMMPPWMRRGIKYVRLEDLVPSAQEFFNRKSPMKGMDVAEDMFPSSESRCYEEGS